MRICKLIILLLSFLFKPEINEWQCSLPYFIQQPDLEYPLPEHTYFVVKP